MAISEYVGYFIIVFVFDEDGQARVRLGLGLEEPLASYLSPDIALSLKAPALPTKACQTTSDLVGRAYMAVGWADRADVGTQSVVIRCSMAIKQVYQADLLRDLDDGEGVGPDDVSELRRAADLSLHITKETHRAISHSMAALVVTERHLWLNLSGIREKDKMFLLHAPLSHSGLF